MSSRDLSLNIEKMDFLPPNLVFEHETYMAYCSIQVHGAVIDTSEHNTTFVSSNPIIIVKQKCLGLGWYFIFIDF